MKFSWIAFLAMTFAACCFAQLTPPTTRPAATRAQIDLLFKQLGADEWQIRQQAQDELVKLGPDLLPDLQKLQQATTDEEVRTRVELAIKQIRANNALLLQFKFTPNEDVITEKHWTANDPGATVGIDIGGSCFLSQSEADFRSTNRGMGLPDDERIGDVQFLPYDQKNVARRADNTPIDIECTPGRYSAVTFFACAGSHTNTSIPGADVVATLTYSTGDPVTEKFLIPDWALRPPGVACLIDNLDRTVWSVQGTVGVGWEHRTANWAIFSLPVTADPKRQLTSVKLAREGNAGIVNLFAVGGIVVPDSSNPAYVQAAAIAATRPAPRYALASTRPVRAVPAMAAVRGPGPAVAPRGGGIVVAPRGAVAPAPPLNTKFVQFKITPNADVIVDKGEANAGATAGIDASGTCFLSESEARNRGGEPGRGLPDNGRIGDVQLLPYDQNNAARRTDGTPIDVEITPGRYAAIAFHGCAGSDADGAFPGATVTILLTYSTGVPTVLTTTLPDSSRRLGVASSLIQNLGHTRATPQGALAAGFEYQAPGSSIFSMPARPDPNRTLTGVRLIRTGAQGVVNVFAVSGQAVVDPQDAANPATTRPGAPASNAPIGR